MAQNFGKMGKNENYYPIKPIFKLLHLFIKVFCVFTRNMLTATFLYCVKKRTIGKEFTKMKKKQGQLRKLPLSILQG